MSRTDQSPYALEVFFDGACPLCRREMRMLQRRDRNGQIRFTDIAALDFDPHYLGKSRQDLMARIHARRPDGAWVEGVEVFRQLYALAGFGFFVKWTRLPLIAPLLDRAYALFARNRFRLTGRCGEGSCARVPVPVPVRDGTNGPIRETQ